MKLKHLIAAATVATIGSTAVMAEGLYVGTEYTNESLKGKSNVGQAEVTIKGTYLYAGYETEFLDTWTLDSRIDYTRLNGGNSFTYSAEINKEFNNIDVYGKYKHQDAGSSLNRSAATIGARYNFN